MTSPFPATTRPDNPTVGIALKVAAVCLMMVMAACLKGSDDVPVGQMVFFRSFFGIIPTLVFLAMNGELIAGLKTSRPMGHLLRGIFAVFGMGLLFISLSRLPLPEAVAIGYAQPILLVVFGALFLGEQVRLYRWSAVLVGVIGVAIIVWPRLTLFADGGSADWGTTIGVLAGIGGAIASAFAAIQVSRLLQTERSGTITLYLSITCSIAGLATIPFGWVWPTTAQWAMLIGAGLAGGIGQVLVTESYRHADVSVVAPFEYSSLILSVLIGYFIFQDLPTLHMIVGGLIVSGAGLFIIWRERALGIERRQQKANSPPA